MARRSPLTQGQHDTAIAALADHWADRSKYNITTNPDGQKNRWVGGQDCYPDLIAWSNQNGRDTAHWIVEVETADSVNENEARSQWADYARTGVPLSLAVPSGSGAEAWAIASRLGIAINKVFEFRNEYSQIVVVDIQQSAYAGRR